MTHPALAGFDDWIAAELAKWQVPGAAVAVISKGEVIHTQGYGLRDVANNLPVTPETLFAIGSCSKAFTSFDLALLVEAGQINWDTPIRQYLPDFRMYDPVATEQMTARDLVSHRGGLPRHDFVWYGSPFSREELYQRLRYLKPNKPFRYGYEYQNLMFMLAGYLVGKVAGTSWEAFTQQHIFDRLGMSASNFSVSVSEKATNAALPYELHDEIVKAVPFRNLDSIAPAGSINSNLVDLLKWLRLHMQGDESLLPRAALKRLHSPHTVIPVTPDLFWNEYGEIEHTAYALGWASQTYRGHSMIRHAGGIDGFISSVSFLPHDDLGVIILTNLGEHSAATIIQYNLYDRLLGLDPLPWSERIQSFNDRLKAAGAESKQKTIAARRPATSPSHPLADYAARYQHPAYGTLDVRLADNALTASYNGIQFRLDHHHYDMFECVGLGDVDLFLLAAFENDLDGSIRRLSLPFEPSGDPIVFERI